MSLSPMARFTSALFVALLASGLGACDSPDSPRLETPADSMAWRVTEGAGGLKAWNALPGIAFEWAVVQDSTERIRTRHVWDKQGERVRSEWPVGTDSIAVAVYTLNGFDPSAPTGTSAINGRVLTGAEASERIAEANGRFVNDSYWMLAPLKVLDPGVRRAIERRGGFDRLALSFDGVGLTPGDRYWIEVDDVTGSMTGWSYQLEGSGEGDWDWTESTLLDSQEGPITIARMKVNRADSTVILTEPTLLESLDETEFTDLRPRLVLR